jgi:hypothetical protein
MMKSGPPSFMSLVVGCDRRPKSLPSLTQLRIFDPFDLQHDVDDVECVLFGELLPLCLDC